MIEDGLHEAIECRPRTFPKPLSTILQITFVAIPTICLIAVTLLSLWMPDATGKGVTNSIPFGWLIWVFGFLVTFSSPSLLIVDDTGMEVHIFGWRCFLRWQDIDGVVVNRYQTFVYSNQLPWVSYLGSIPLFRFQRLFAIHWRFTNYQVALEKIQKHLAAKIEEN